jgi:flagellar basal-body rod protein FlgB
MRLLDATGTRLATALDVLGRRHEILSSNLANAQTPGYARGDLDFTAALRAANEREERHDPENAAGGGDVLAFVRNDGTQPDLELEMAEVASNTMHFLSVTTLLTMKLDLLRTAIQEGRR